MLSAVLLGMVSFNTSFAATDSATSFKNVVTIQVKQAKSIEQGRNLGKLTPREVKKLTTEQQEIKKLETVMKQDGVLTQAEIKTLFKKLEISRKNISRLARNSISTSAKSI